MVKDIGFYAVPNDIITGTVICVSLLTSSLSIRYLYVQSERKHNYQNDQVHLGVLGLRWIKFLSVLVVIVTALLGFRMNSWVSASEFWSGYTLGYSWWIVIRLWLAFTHALCAMVFETHPAFRIWCFISAPLLAILDLISQAFYARDISCLEHGVCARDDYTRTKLYLYAWRDIVGAIITLTSTAVSGWLGLQFGWWYNDLWLARSELRQVSERVGKMKLKPKRVEKERQLMNDISTLETEES